MKKGLAILLTLILVLSMLPVTAMGAESMDSGSDRIIFGGHSYQIFNITLSWNDAKDYCEKLGGHLVTITSAREQEFIEELNSDNLSLWIGGYRDNSLNWYWVTGEKWNYTNWDEGEPNNSSNVIANENCVAIWSTKWNDLNDSNMIEQSGFICEWEKVDILAGIKELIEAVQSLLNAVQRVLRILNGIFGRL